MDYWLVDHGLRVRVRVLAVAEQLVEHNADREKVWRDVPPCEVRVGWLVGRRARTRPYLVADPGSDVEVKQFRSCSG